MFELTTICSPFFYIILHFCLGNLNCNSGQVCHQAYLHGYDSAKKWIWPPAVWEQNFISISRYNCFQRGKVLKDVISRIYKHISSQLDYFRIHFSLLATQEFGIKNGIIKGKGKALATQGKFSKSTPYMERLFTETERLNQTLFVIHFENKEKRDSSKSNKAPTKLTLFHYDHIKFFNDINSY